MAYKNCIITSDKPATEWLSGYPCGNGHTGFMLWGTPSDEVFSFNHEELFRKKIKKDIKTASLIPEIRRLTLSGNAKSAESLFEEKMLGFDPCCNPYQPFCDLKLSLGCEKTADYRRSLDMSTGITEILTDKYRLEAFADLSGGQTLIRIEFSSPTEFEAEYGRTEDSDCEYSRRLENGKYLFNGKFTEGVTFKAEAVIFTDGIVSGEEVVKIKECGFVEIRCRLTLGEDISLDCEANYEKMKLRHTECFKNEFERFCFSVSRENKCSKELYSQAVEDRSFDSAIYEYFINMAKYIYISAGNGRLPLNLQGIWCDKIKPDWDCGYTTDINIQMAYFPANAMGFSDYQLRLFDWLDSHTELMKRQCENIFGIKNALYVPQYTDVDMVPSTWRGFASFQVLWSAAAAWLSRHYYEYWMTSGDDEFMLNRGLPFLKGCAAFYEEFLTKDGDGKYIICPSCNPENFTENGEQLINSATMDISVIHELMKNIVSAHRKLGISNEKISLWQEIDKNLIDYPFYEDGTLAEYHTEAAVGEEDHRHLSHLYGMYPAKLFRGDRKMTEACEKALKLRHRKGFKGTSSWSMSWHACLAAAMNKPQRALEYINYLIVGMVMENFLPSHNDWREGTRFCHGEKVFQIDAVYGISAAICEMLIFADENETVLLPSLPEEWKSCGEVKGLCGYAAEFDIAWENSEITYLRVKAKKDTKLTLKTGIPVKGGADTVQISLDKNCEKLLCGE